ncbi:phosphoglycerate dehydrogenase-like enzyme [Arthrobacter stackebrandtii]|uniref:Phosphoglycerate dehydrogenase-like enzyme n=1 Tax=Arthrobacter stackebrandtii TaxID=272161 RepID=A0ABS4YVL9_9MICC|nr:hydroxyacid dehydrogenase [Arthrobacter stackebrandtii]MBP2412774.1 phosphoglycerate dehydrogenase-like enzyme [Arthrobacter stackebrandtii]PYG99870.1 hydroxyacid dehydrogenase [Arthrobacter stackebrandtii]
MPAKHPAAGLPQATLAMEPGLRDRLFTPAALNRLASNVSLQDRAITNLDMTGVDLSTTEILLGGWGCPVLDAGVLDRMPRLHTVVYTAGTVKGFVTDELFARGIQVSSGAATNAQPVAEFTLAAILLAGKRIFEIDAEYRTTGNYRPASTKSGRWGNYGLTVGIVSASLIGRRVIELLAPFDVEVLLYDPFHQLPGVQNVSLEHLLANSDVVSIHAPELPETRHMLNAETLALMQDGATLINTARGSLVDEPALLAELHARRLHAVVDVTEPDVLPPGSPWFHAPNLTLTPHIAGSQGNEMFRLGDSAVREIERLVAGQPLMHVVRQEALAFTA